MCVTAQCYYETALCHDDGQVIAELLFIYFPSYIARFFVFSEVVVPAENCHNTFVKFGSMCNVVLKLNQGKL